jgi:hypothetical protein
MNKREAKALVCKGIYHILDTDNGWLEVGSAEDNARMIAAFNEILDEFARRSQGAPPVRVGCVDP